MKKILSPDQFIAPLNMNGLRGRSLHLPNSRLKDNEILFVYGQHSSLERWWGLLKYLNHFGAVTTLDLPGLGGMESFYKINKNPTIDNYADYLASFIKMRYKRKKLTIIGFSFGFVIVTRMLQRNPELSKKVSLLVSLVGFTHKKDFKFNIPKLTFYRAMFKLLTFRTPSFLFQKLALSRIVILATYRIMYSDDHKSVQDLDQEKEAEIWLWQHNDLRTQAATTVDLLNLDNCQTHIDLPIWHINAHADQYFDNNQVEQHLRVVFRKVFIVRSSFIKNPPSVLFDENDAMGIIPPELQQIIHRL